MSAIFSKIAAFFMAILAFFGLVKPTEKPILIEGECKVEIMEQDIYISMNSNPSTGYGWEYSLKGSSVEFVSKDFSSPSYKNTKNNFVPTTGEGGIECFKFKAVNPGQTVVSFKYLRNWESFPPADEFTLTIEVAQDMSVNYFIWE